MRQSHGSQRCAQYRTNDVTTVTSCSEYVTTYDCLFECSWIGPDKRGALANWESRKFHLTTKGLIKCGFSFALR